MGDFKPGSMDIEEQEKTFSGFVKFTIWATAIIILVLIFLGLVNS